MSRLLEGSSRLLGPATIKGRLIQVCEEYPAALPPEGPGDIIYGELVELSSPESSLKALDEYEGQEYMRAIVEATLPGRHAPLQAWTYLYTAKADGLPLIPSGTFKAKAGKGPG